MADQPITTSIDSLVKYLKEHGETDTTALSRVLGVNEGTIVDWADILEKAGMVKIAYKVGKMFLSPTDSKISAGQIQVEKAVGDVKKAAIENEILAQQDILNEVRSKLEIYSKTAKNAESIFKEKGGEAKIMLDRITILEKQANRHYNELNAKHENVNKMVEGFDKEIKSLESDADQIRQFNLDTSGAKGVLDDISNRITVFNSSVTQMRKEFERMTEEHKKQLKAIETSVNTEINVLKETASSEGKKIAEYDRLVSDYRKKADAQAKRTAKMRTQMLDDAIKTRDEVLGIYSAASAQFNVLNKEIQTMKDSWGLLAVFNDRLIKINYDIDALTKELDGVEKQLSGTSTSLKNPKATPQAMRDLEANAKGLRGSTNSVSKKAEQIGKDMADLTK